MEEYERSWLAVFDGRKGNIVGYVGRVAARKWHARSLDLSWYPNLHSRFHEVAISLPKDQFVACIGCWRYDEKPHIFVKSEWLEKLYLKLYSVFALIDAIGVREALKSGSFSRAKLINLREAIDDLAKRHKKISFISFADSLLLKSNWSVGHFRSRVKYTYQPEIFLQIIKELQEIYRATLGLEIYAILTQGGNEYYEDSLLHISKSRNHICLNSLGIPFAELMAIEGAVRSAIRSKRHDPAEIYMDAQFFRSLSFKFGFEKKSIGKFSYKPIMMGNEGAYYLSKCNTILDGLK